MSTEALFTIALKWKQSEFPSINEWIQKLWDIHTVEYYSAIRENEALPFAAA